MWETQSQEFYDSEDDLDEKVNNTHSPVQSHDVTFLSHETMTTFL